MAPQYQSHTLTEDATAGEILPDVVISGPIPLGTVPGDLLIAFMTGRAQGGVFVPTYGLGFTELFPYLLEGSQYLAVAIKEAGAGEPSSYDFTFGTETRSRQLAIMRISGAKVGDPISIWGNDFTQSATAVCPSVNAPDADSLIVRTVSYQRTTSMTPDPGPTEHWNRLSGGGSGNRHMAGGASLAQAGAGPTGTFTWTGASWPWITSTIVVAPDAAPQPSFLPAWGEPFNQVGLP